MHEALQALYITKLCANRHCQEHQCGQNRRALALSLRIMIKNRLDVYRILFNSRKCVYDGQARVYISKMLIPFVGRVEQDY